MRYVMPFIVSMMVAMAGVPLLGKFAAKWGILDKPGGRKVHAVAIPCTGGIAMALGVFVAALIAMDLQPQDRWFLLAAAVMVVFGALDDRFDLDYRVKFIGQMLAVGIVFAGGVQVQAMTLYDQIMLPGWISLPLTILFLVGITNAVNLADGLDGLAGGNTFLCLCAVALLSSAGEPNGNTTALSLAFAGAVLGFLRFNTHPATVFMGDAGSQLLGFAIGVLSIRATQSLTTQVSTAIPILLLAIPILDTLSVIVQRIGDGRSPFSADKNHIHHKLLALGFGHHEAVMAIYTMQGALFVAAYFLRYESDLTILAIVTAFFVVAITVMQLASRFHWRLRGNDAAAAESPLSQFIAVLRQPQLLPRFSYLAIVIALGLYAALIVVSTVALSADLRALVLALFALAIGLLALLRVGSLGLIDKAALYVTTTMLVYLDAVASPADRLMAILTWVAVSVAAVATAVRLRLQNDRRFQVTPLDLIVLFMALIVPSLGPFNLPHGGALVIAKLLILFYAIEVMVSRSDGRAVWMRVAVVSILAGLAVRPLIPF